MVQNNLTDESFLRLKESQEGYDKVTLQAALCVLGSWSILLIIGAQLSWGNMSNYIASYFHYLGEDVTME